MPYKVTVERNTLRFAAAHFATGGGACERLHGHNYDVTVEIEGELTDDGWVIDFAVLKSLTRELCLELDHRFILQRDSNQLDIEEHESTWKIRFLDRSWVFPTSDVAALPIENSTAEQLARWFAGRLHSALAARGATKLASITVGVEEQPGQTGWWTERFG